MQPLVREDEVHGLTEARSEGQPPSFQRLRTRAPEDPRPWAARSRADSGVLGRDDREQTGIRAERPGAACFERRMRYEPRGVLPVVATVSFVWRDRVERFSRMLATKRAGRAVRSSSAPQPELARAGSSRRGEAATCRSPPRPERRCWRYGVAVMRDRTAVEVGARAGRRAGRGGGCTPPAAAGRGEGVDRAPPSARAELVKDGQCRPRSGAAGYVDWSFHEKRYCVAAEAGAEPREAADPRHCHLLSYRS